MLKFFKYLLIGILLLIIVGFVYIRFAVHEPRPTIVDGDADAMAQSILKQVNKPAWDSLPIVEWTFRGEHHYLWDRTSNTAIISWDDQEVHLDMDQVRGKLYQNDALVTDEAATSKAVATAWSFWCNDMWWFAAPFKVMDEEASRQIALDKDGKQGLLVTYDSGGVTPGDSYLWYVDENGLPTGYKMWVKIIPIGGVYTSWEDWQILPGGARVATNHTGKIKTLTIPITNIKAGTSWSDFGHTQNPIQL
ncbi:MAG: hypothetical protein AAFQ02_01460 [Bacteroidota bacterium]